MEIGFRMIIFGPESFIEVHGNFGGIMKVQRPQFPFGNSMSIQNLTCFPKMYEYSGTILSWEMVWDDRFES